jgi:hypothetical protein
MLVSSHIFVSLMDELDEEVAVRAHFSPGTMPGIQEGKK